MDPLKPFFEPKSVVVVGASRDQKKLGYGVARNLCGSGYPGDVYFVNPKGGALFGKKILKSVDELESGIDLALIVIQAKLVPQILIACSHKGIKNYIILTSGFKESGIEGEIIENSCKQIANEKRLRVIGPNCIGIIDTHFPIDTSFIHPPIPDKGEIAFITHSGALGAALIDWARGEGMGFSRLISLGNQMDVDESDVLNITADAKSTKAVMMYLESIRDGTKFLEQARFASDKKPIVALKVGRTLSGERAALSHTGALAGSDIAYEAAFRRARILRANNTEEMFAWAKILAALPEPENNRVAILTNAGGPGVIAADTVEERGLRMAKFSSLTLDRLKNVLPEAASIINPVDMLASASPNTYGDCLKILLEDTNVDMVCVIAPPPPMYSATDISMQVIGALQYTSKPVVVSFMGSRLVKEAINELKRRNIPNFSFPEEGIAGLAALWQNKLLHKQDQEILGKSLPHQKKNHIQTILEQYQDEKKFISTDSAEKIFKIYDLPVLSLHFAPDEESAVLLASQIGYPVVMKISIEGVSHKSDVAGILLDLHTEDEIRDGFRKLKINAANQNLRGDFRGVHIQKMINSGQEVIVGAIRDRVFGPMVMFGSGGVEVEGLKDIKFALAPLTGSDLDYIIKKTWAGKRLQGFRHFHERDINAVKDSLVKIAQIMLDFHEIEEIEVNPLIVAEKTKGAFAVDIRMVVDVSNKKE